MTVLTVAIVLVGIASVRSQEDVSHEKEKYQAHINHREKQEGSYGLNNLLKGTPFDDMIEPTAHENGYCAQGSACDMCPEGEYKWLKVRDSGEVKVCCPACGQYFRTAYDRKGTPVCACDSVEAIKGDCWKGDQCRACNSSNNGQILSIPVCCPHCEESGLRLTYSSCDCLHNGPSREGNDRD